MVVPCLLQQQYRYTCINRAFEFGYFSEGAAVGILLIIMNIAVAFVYLKLFDARNKK